MATPYNPKKRGVDAYLFLKAESQSLTLALEKTVALMKKVYQSMPEANEGAWLEIKAWF